MKDNAKLFYSSDIVISELEGSKGIISALSYLVSAPIRIICTVIRNVFVLSYDLKIKFYANLFLVSLILMVIGIFDFLYYGKWVLLASQVFVLIISIIMKHRISDSKAVIAKEKEVDINIDEVEDLCNTIYNDLDKIVKDWEDSNNEL